MAKHAIILASLEILKSQDKDALKVTKGMWKKKAICQCRGGVFGFVK